MAEKDYVVVMNGKSKSYTEDQFNSPEMQNWLNSTEGVESYEVSPYDAKEEALDGDSFQLTNAQGQSKNYSRADFERPEMQNWIKANPDYKVSRVRPVLNDAQRKAKAHNDLVDDLAGRREQGEEWAELNDIQNQIIETRKALDNFDKKSSDELANIPGARERVNKQAQQMKTRGQLLSSLRELEDKYYNHNLKIQQRVQGKQGAQVANENLDKLFAPYKEEAQRQRSQRSPMLATVPFGGAYAQPTKEEVLYTAAKNLNDDTVRLYDAPSKYGKENGFDNYLKGAGDRASQVDFWTMGLTGIVDQYALKGVLDKIRTELGGMKELTAENIDETLSPMEKEVLSAFLRNADAQADRAQDLSRGYQAGQGAMDSAMFMAQFILSGAITSGAVDILSSGAAKGLSQWISNVIGKEAKTAATTAVKQAVGRLSGDAAEAVVYSMLQPGTMKSILEAQNSLDETGEIVDQRNAAFKGYLDYLVEVFSEHTGDYLGNVVGSLGGKKLVNALSQTEFGKWGKAFLSSDKVKALRAGQWHGFLGEVSEEFIGAAMRDLSGLDPDAWEEQTKGENLAIMALSFLPMTLIGGTASTVKYAAARSDFKESDENLRNIMGTLGFDKEQIDHATDVTRLSSPEEIENTVRPILKEMRQRGASEEELRSVMDFAFNAARINVYDSFRETEAQEKRDAVQAELVGTYGDFWQGDEEKTVQRTTLPDGRSGYVKGANEEGEMIVLLDDGSTAFAKDTEVTTETLDQYLDSVILARKEQEDAEIVEEEARDARQTFQQRIAERAPIEMGTPENPISGTLVTNMDPKLGEIPARDENGNYLVQTSAKDEDGISNISFVPLSENDLARKWGIELNPKTQEELEADQLEAYQTAQARKDLYNIIPAGTEVQATLDGLDSPVKYSFVRAVYDEDSQAVQIYVEDMDTHEEVMLPESAIPGLEQLAAEQTQKAEQEAESEEVAEETAVDEAPEVLRDFKGNPIPLKEDGSVDKTAFWTRDPEAWAAWNDSQRNDGGADTIEYVSAAVKKAEGDLKKLNAAKSKELDFDKRDALEAKKKPLEDRIAALNNILTGYKNRQEKEKEQEKQVAAKPAEVIPSNITDEVREFFSALNKRGELRGKLNKADFKRELGWGEAETKPFFGWWAKKGQGRTLVSLAEELANDYDSQYGYIHSDGDQKDTQEARNAIIAVLNGASKPSEVFSIEAQEEYDPYKDDLFAEALMIQEAKEREEMEWIEESAGSADLAAVDQENYTNFTSEYYNYYGQTESAGALESPQVGAEAVPGSESDDAGRILSVGEQPGEAAVSNADEGGVVPGAEPGGQDALAGGEQGAVEGPGADAQSTQEVVQGSLDFENETQAAVAAAEAEVDQNPTEAQKEAGNYKKGHVTIDGYDITIENPKGSVRSGVDASGREWSQTMNNTYGYIRMTEGVDGDHIDVFLSDNPEHGDVFVVDQVNKDGSFDEHKVMYGFPDEESARAAYLSNYEEGWTGLGNITGVTKDEFKKWVESSHRKTKPFAEYKSVNTINEEPQAPERETARSERVAKITADIEKLGELDKEYDRLWKEWLSDNSIDNSAQRIDLSKQQSSLERSIKASLAWATEEELDEVEKIDSNLAKELVADERKRRGASKRHSRVSAIIAERQSVPKVKAKALGKLNLYNYTDHDEFRPVLNGVFHDDGFAVANDSHFLVAIKEGYDKKNNGKVIHKDGKEIAGTYPKWRSIIPNGETQKMDFSALRDFLAGVKEAQEKKYESLSDEEKKKSKKKEMVNRSKIILNVGNDLNIAFLNEELTKFADNAERIGAKELIFSDERHAVAAKTSKGVVLVMPVQIDWRDDKEEDEGYQADNLIAGGTYSFGKNEYQKSLETQPTLTEAQKKSLAFIENKSTEEVTEEVRQQPLKDRIKAWEDRTGQKVEAIEKFDDVKDKTARAAILTGQNPSGWFDTKTGRVVIYLPNVTTESEIDQTYMHEIVSHKGLRELLGQERFNALMDSVWDDIMSEEDRKYWLDYNSHLTDLDEQGLRRAAADEYVANLAENVDSNPTAWERFVEKVKEILNKLGFDIKITDADLRTLLQASLANYERQQRELRAQAEAQQQAREDTQAFLDGKRTRDADTAAAQSAPQAVVSESQEKYEDFGEKIGWARKDLAKKGIKKGDGDSRPAWLKKYQTQNVEEVPEQVKAAAEKMGIRSNGFVPVAQDIIKGTDFTKPFIAYYEKKSKGYFGNRVAKRYITGEDRQPIVFTSLEQYEAAVPVFEAHDQGYRVKQNGDKFFIVRPASNGKVVEYAQFDTKEEATAYLTSPEGCVSLLNKKRENYELPALEELTRNNMPDYRKGNNITPQDILDTFGFRGGEFGNWLNAEERQQFLNYAYDALMDLSNVIGVSPKALSLNGELSIAFGARGRQGAKAHYEPTKAVINLTKMNGAGSLAHEWAHAMDNYFGIMDAKAVRNREEEVEENLHYLSEGPSWKRGAREEMREAFKNVMDTIKGKVVTRQIALDKAQKEYDDMIGYARRQMKNQYREQFARGLTKYQYNRKTKERDVVKIVPTEEQLAEYDRLTALLETDPTFKFDWDYKKAAYRASGDVASQLYELVKDVMPNRGGERYGPLHNAFYYLDKALPLRERLEKAKAGETETVKIKTAVLEDSQWFDRGRAGEYWQKDVELFARSFETYVSGELKSNNQSSDYLTYEKGPLYQKLWDHNPYPAGEERDAVKKAFDHFFDVIQEKSDEQTGRQVLFRKFKDEESQYLFDRAKEFFGTTNDLNEAGYILPDGSMLDFSGRHQVEGDSSFLRGRRSVDHRDIFDLAYEKDGWTETGIETDMADFINRGAIRIDSNAGAINLSIIPTEQQISKLSRLIEKNGGDVYVDFGAPDTDHYAEYSGAKASRVINDIKRYFTEGYKPEGNIMFRKAPNGQPSNLTAEQWEMVRTPQFKNWFGDWENDPDNASKVVDENGEPLVMYHGTRYGGFNKFDTGNEQWPRGAYFTRDEKSAMEYANYDDPEYDEAELDRMVYSVFLNVRNPLAVDENGGAKVGEYNIHIREINDMDGHARAIVEAGYDGVIAESGFDEMTVVFNPSQIKSATDNTGAFNPENPDIRFRITPEQDKEYFDAIEAGDEKKVMQLVKAAAKSAGYTTPAYHGTRSNFNIFRYNPDDIGFHFGDKKTARERVGRGKGATVMPVYLNIKNALNFDEDLGAWDGEYICKYMLAHNLITADEAKEILITPGGYQRDSREKTRRMRQVLRDKGFNTITYPNWYESDGSTSYIMLDQRDIKSAEPIVRDDSGNVISLSQRFNPISYDIRFRKVTDPAKIEELENGDKETGYRTVVLNPDGTLGSPMAGRLGKKGAKSVKTSGFAFGEWEEAEENPGIATEDGKVNLIKPNGRGEVPSVDYNPYIHIRPNTINKQFTQAWKRPELVYIETQYPASELTSGYQAEKAKKPVGRHDWNGGELILSRYDKPVRVVPWGEVADEWAKEFKDGVTFDIVSPDLLPFLVDRGVKILPPKKAAGSAAMDAYNDWRGESLRFRKANENQAIFISNAENALGKIKMDKATPEQWVKMLEKEGGLKAGEDKWLGLSEWLKGLDRKTVTKQEVADFINQNKIQIEEQHYKEGGNVEELQSKYPGWDDAFEIDEDEFGGQSVVSIFVSDEEKAVDVYNAAHPDNQLSIEDGDLFDAAGDFVSWDVVTDWAKAEFDSTVMSKDGSIVRPIEGTRYQYTTIGLDNKREIALTIPTIEPWNESDEVHFGDAGEGRAVAWVRFGDAKLSADQTVVDEAKEKHIKADEAFNKLVHELKAKYNVNTYGELLGVVTKEERAELRRLSDDSGNTLNDLDAIVSKGAGKVLFIDEIQSKRHQEAREKGYVEGQAEMKKAYKEAHERVIRYSLDVADYHLLPAQMSPESLLTYLKEIRDLSQAPGMKEMIDEQTAQLTKLLNERNSLLNKFEGVRKGVPAAPFEKNWHELAMKRMLRYAAENGYDVVAWTTGEQQADRYSIGTKVKELEATESAFDGAYKDIYANQEHIAAIDKEGKIINGEYAGSTLSELVGKELAARLMAKGRVTLTGDSLRIGGEGMNGFYDDMLVRFMNKYGKKWGVSVEDIELPQLEGAGIKAHSVRVTPEMKESVMEGQLMFRKVTPEEDAEYMQAVEAGDMAKAQEMVNNAAEAAMKNSKVRGEDGKLKVVYHGTQHSDKLPDFYIFSLDRMMNGRTFGDGFYFTDSEELGEKWAERFQGRGFSGTDEYENLTPRLIKAFLNIENIIDVSVEKVATYGELDRVIRAEHQAMYNNGIREDGLVIRGIKDGYDVPSDVYVAFSPDQIKSADPVTYDDEGNVIPLSKRFQDTSDDIRFRITQKMDAEYEEAYKNGDTEKAQRMVDKAFLSAYPDTKIVKEDGSPEVLYRGDTGLEERGYTGGVFYSHDKDFADRYGDVNRFYIDSKKPFNPETDVEALRPFVEKNFAELADEYDYYFNDNSDPFGESSDERFNSADEILDSLKGGYWTMYEGSDMIVNEIYRLGFDSIRIEEDADNLWLKDGMQAKLADPFTFDNDGNLIPLSLRFDNKANDIRFRTAYHGSRANFDRFENGHYREGTGSFHRPGFYFASDEKSAKKYAYDRGNGAYLYEVELPDDNGSNYIHMYTSMPKKDRVALAEKIKKTFPDKEFNENRFIRNSIVADSLLGHFTNDELQQLGFVGIVGPMYIATMPQEQIVIFDPKDIKVKGKKNVTTGEDIRFKIGDPVKKAEPAPEELLAKVQEFGLRGVMDKEQVAEYYADALRLMPEETRNEVIDKAFGKDLNVRRQTKEYLASLALKGYAEDQSGLLRALANKIQESIPTDKLSENELLYMIWRDANRYSDMDLLSLAQDIALRRKLRVADYSGEKFPTEVKEAISRAETRIDQAEETREAGRQAARKEVKKSPLSSITKAMMAQRGYDQETVNSIVALAKDMIKRGSLDSTTSREMARLLTIIKDAVGRKPAAAKESAKKLLDFMIDHELKTERELLDKMLKVKTATVKKPGVDVQAKLDIHTQGVINAFKENVKKSEAEIRTSISNLEDKMENASEARKEEIQSELEGLNLALQYATEIDANVKENEAIRQQIADAKKEFDELPEAEKKQFRSALNQEVEASYEKIRENRIERVNAFRELRAAVAEVLSEGTEKAKSFIERERARVNQIHHEANSDMQGVDDDPIEPKSSVMTKLTNNQVARFLTAPLATFDQMLRLLGRKHPNGQGYLWTRYMTQRRAADDNEKLGLDAANETLNAKVQEIFKDPTMTWNDLYHLERGMNKATIKFFNANGEWKEEELTQGNLLYIYMVDKMTDGQMKLRQMNITEENVREIKKALDPRFVKLADWMQGEFLPQLRDKYNEVHKRLFGTSMASIENYFPLRILGGVIKEEIDLSNPDSDALPSAMTGAIIKRTVNRKQLDITNSDAFSVMIEHVQEMEHWAAFAEFNKDLSTLLSYKRFQNQVKHLNTIYGSGKNLWGNFKKVAVLAAGEYRPARTPLDTAAVNLAKGVSTAKIAFRAYTALKQILSWPAFLADANIVELAKASSPTNWKENWDWAMQNLPNFKKRVEKRTVGNEKLEADELDAPIWSTGLAQWISKYGMSMNAFVDALTVSIGAKAMYETKYKQYASEGYAPRTAKKKAMFDAVTLFNETQQSSEKEFMSTMQADKTVVSVALSVYRNASFGYQRQVHQGLRTLSRVASKGYKEKSIEYMTKQLVRDGMSEADAKKAAEQRYDNSVAQAAVRVAVFGFLMQFAWNLGAQAIYLLFGNDPDKKNEMLAQDAKKALSGGMIEGLAGGSIMSDLLSKFENGESIYGYDMNTLPIMQDIKNTIAKFNTDPVAAANDLVFLGVQIGLGTNPQTFSDAILAIVDACNGDFGTAKEAMLCILRILQVPQSQLDELMIDEIGMTAGQARELTYEEVAQRYADYKVRRNAPITGALYSDELREKREKAAKTTFKKKYNKRQE